MKPVPKNIREIAKQLRNNMTPAEVRLWARIKNNQVGIKFLRQKPLCVQIEDSGLERWIIPDFYCSEKQLVIEVDGNIHLDKAVDALDREKEKLLKNLGIEVLRINNKSVLEDTDNCIDHLQNNITQLSLGKREHPKGEGFVALGSLTNQEIIPRCAWVNLNNELYVKYHDEEWGVPVHDDRVLFEFLILEGAQAGLSWETVLKKRESYREAFDSFDVQKIVNYDEDKIQELLENPGIIRNKLKIRSTIKNAKAFIDIQKEFGSFSKYLWNYVGDKQIINNLKIISEVPVSTELSDRISKDLKKRGMSFVGTTIMYAYMQAVGLVNDHTTDCYFHKI